MTGTHFGCVLLFILLLIEHVDSASPHDFCWWIIFGRKAYIFIFLILGIFHFAWVGYVCQNKLNKAKVFKILGCILGYVISVMFLAAIVWKYSSAVYIHMGKVARLN